jgi:mycofactocin precursor
MPETLTPPILDRPALETPSSGGVVEPQPAAPPALKPVTAETLVEEVSIDGMCGVY